MSTIEPSASPARPRVLNPLWIISLFLGISETTLGIAATQATGWIQGLFAVSATVFPLLVSAAFFSTLWKKPEVLYAPGDFPEHVRVTDFVHGIHRSMPGDLKDVGSIVQDTLKSVLPTVLAPRVSQDTVEEVVSEAVASARTDLKKRTIKIDLSRIGTDVHQAEWVIDPKTTITNLLDSLWLTHLRHAVPPFTYSERWVLVDRQTRKTFDQMGSKWAEGRFPDGDNRPLEVVGIFPGMELDVVLTDEG